MSAKRQPQMTLPLPVQFLAAWIGVWPGRYQQELKRYGINVDEYR